MGFFHLIFSVLICILPLISTATPMTAMGERSEECNNVDADDVDVKIDAAFAGEAKNLIKTDKLSNLIIPYPNCVRVGTEIKLFLDKVDIGLVGKAFLSAMEVKSANQIMLNNPTAFSKKSLNKFFQGQPGDQFAVLTFKVAEKVEETFLNGADQKLQTCFTLYGTWEDAGFEYQEGAQMVKDIQSGTIKADIWNGIVNCYKIGTPVAISVYRPDQPTPEDPANVAPTRAVQEDYGVFVPKELHLLHYTHLTEKHASFLNEKLSDLVKRLEAKKEIDGGYVTMVVFEHQPTPPKFADKSAKRDRDATDVQFPGRRRRL